MDRRDIDFQDWDEDGYASRGSLEEEYRQEIEEEDEEYPIGYANIQGNWDIDDEEYYAGNGHGNFRKITKKVHSIKTPDNIRTREYKKQQKKRRDEYREREKQRQAYYHYGDSEGED